MIEPEHRGDRFAVLDFVVQNHFHRFGQGNQMDFNDFIVFRFGLASAQAGGEIHRHGFRHEAWARIELQDAAPALGAVSGLFDEFALGGLQFLFAGIDASGGKFPEIILGGMTVLALEQHARDRTRIVDGHHHDRAGVVNEVAASFDASGLADVVGGDPEDGSSINGAGRDQASFRGLLFLGRRRFGHGNNIKHEQRTLDFRPRTSSISSAILAVMRGKPRIAIVGPGNLGAALAASLHAAGYEIDAIVAHSPRSLRRARRLARRLDCHAIREVFETTAELVWFCVPDSAIASAAREAARDGCWNGRTALHSSGALTSDELVRLRERGASVASVHPLMTFVRGSSPSLDGVPFAIEGDAVAVRAAREIVRDLGGRAFDIRNSDKTAYHTWGTFASPLMTALLATTERVAEAAGVSRREAARRMMPILRQTLANYEEFGPVAGFSGPIVRGDAETVRKHLGVLRKNPRAAKVYCALAEAALDYLPAKNKKVLKQLLNSFQG